MLALLPCLLLALSLALFLFFVWAGYRQPIHSTLRVPIISFMFTHFSYFSFFSYKSSSL
ncbi:hypothetical protein AB4K20DRAFT_1882901 [Rhizopus microsporus]